MDEPSNAVLGIKIDVLTNLLERFEKKNDDDHLKLQSEVENTNCRVSLLEMYKNKQIGALTVISATIGSLVTLIISLVIRHMMTK